jgi:signal transduction histidine kinase
VNTALPRVYRVPVDTSCSAREAEARAHADERLRRQRKLLRPFGLLVIVAVAVGVITGNPAAASHGAGLGVAVAFLAFAGALALVIRGRFRERSVAVQTAVIAVMGAAGVALVALQPHGATEVAGGAAVWMAVMRLPLRIGLVVAGATTAGLGMAAALAGSSAAAVVAGVLLCALLGLVAFLMRQARSGQDTTELLLAQLEDARGRELEAAAITERSRIATELHDVLAHSLSGAALQLQGARKLAEHDGAGPQLRGAIDRAGELVREGLVNARQAVGALHGDPPGVAQLDVLVATFRTDTESDVTLTIEGEPRPLSADAGLTLYRGAQEALTNIGRYAPGATATMVLRYDAGRTSLTVEDVVAGAAPREGLAGVGGGNGLAGLRDRLERTGGTLEAGPTDEGWRVHLEVPE